MNKDFFSLTQGPILSGIIKFTFPIFLAQLLQQLYNMADAWVVGNYTDNQTFAGVSLTGSTVFLVIGFINGIATGGGVVISRFFGARDEKNVVKAVHTNVLFGLILSAVFTTLTLVFLRSLLGLMNIPDEVLPHSVEYLQVYFAGLVTVVMNNVFMAIMRAMGDSVKPLIYLTVSVVANIGLDVLFVAVFGWGARGAAIATVIAQGLSAGLCLIRMVRQKGLTSISIKKLRFYPAVMKDVALQGFPAGIQNSVISIGNIMVQSSINAFGEFAIAGMGAQSKVEGIVFIPIASISMAISTFISQNVGAGHYDRVKKGTFYSLLISLALAEGIGFIYYFFAGPLIGVFTPDAQSVAYGVIHAGITTMFYFLLAYSHTISGVLRGMGKAVGPMVSMLAFWCVLRIIYIKVALIVVHEFYMISWAYPITWSCSSVLLTIMLISNFKRLKGYMKH